MPVRDINKVTHTNRYRLPKNYGYGTGNFSAQWEVRLWRPGGASTQSANFSITGEIRRDYSGEVQACGRLDEDLLLFAEKGLLKDKDGMLPELLRWQGFHVDRGPWYYVDNSLYWYKIYLRREGKLPPSPHFWERDERPEDAKALDYFKSTIIFGALDDDKIPEIPELPRAPDASDAHVYEPRVAEQRQIAWSKRCAEVVDETLTPWLQGRLPRLMALFEADMVRWFGPEILVPSDSKDTP